ncbi:MAG: 1-acyl-sn-glycerol-3-phosphate acyltransferase [Thermanaerothrix sp.]|nr:1-acyl-sn-glycerol-3-phosphate acyltransferase [Thermanaerothrix sp.]
MYFSLTFTQFSLERICFPMLSEKLLYYASQPVVRTFVALALKMEIKHPSPFPKGGKIFAANHPSTADPFFVAAVVREHSFILINNLLFQVPLLGTYLQLSGHIPVKVGEGQIAIDTALKHLAAGHNIMIFPEGDLSPAEGGFHKPRTGVARLALASGAPVIPIGIHLERERLRVIRSTVRGEVTYGRWYLNGPYKVTVGAPLRFEGDVEDRPLVRSVAETIMHHIIELARESENRLNSIHSRLDLAQQVS